jgi:glycosyltransferase involved in cell wall biosynthesis
MTMGFKGFLKQHLYLKYLLPHQVKYVVENAEFFFNLSGDDSCAARGIGWPDHKIVPWGYYSPPIPDSHLVKHVNDSEFTILVTGAMTWHRAPDVALRAMGLLSRWGVPYKGILTQTGPMLGGLKRMAEEHNLPVEFVGLLPMAELIKLYETCSVYVAAGRCEPWGMRLNDALQCGSPLVASRGMGGVKLIDDYGCGAAFDNEDYVGLAHRLKRLAEDRHFYADVAQRAYDAASLISPERKSQELINLLERMF